MPKLILITQAPLSIPYTDGIGDILIVLIAIRYGSKHHDTHIVRNPVHANAVAAGSGK
ncbi:MAG: hypothetical protein MZU84_02900 [Sphingobacterium sp.]|nr:hypothetical protein [Sphingobacterium sp.]